MNKAAVSISVPTTKEDSDITNDTFSTTIAFVPAPSTTLSDTPRYNEQTDEEFVAWILEELKQENIQLYNQYPDVFAKVAQSIIKWRRRYHGNIPLWNRIFKKDRVFKEAMESVPVIHAVDQWMMSKENVTMIDLCSGKGYLSMILSDYLDDPGRVKKCILVDKAWPLCHMTPKPHHISWEHIYGDVGKDSDSKFEYYDSWPIPLVTSKQDLKQSITLRQLQDRYSKSDQGPILILAIHLCGTLSTQAIKLFHMLPKAKALILKPCCLPGVFYQKRQEFFELGNYKFPTKDVCASGKWKSNKKVKGRWKGPPRWHLEGKFHKWCHHLEMGIQSADTTAMHQEGDEAVVNEDKTMEIDEAKKGDSDKSGIIIKTQLLKIPVQTKGGYQNSFLFAEKAPVSNTMWDDLLQRENELIASLERLEEEKQEGNREEEEAPLKKKSRETGPNDEAEQKS
ncbi:unnamed protein product [Cylindrotheca closterium]|uniref:Methyltransferase domain-containing protein n=1 Tax=Cylindrotheca closterium TaxID=2856 RepID=A0AAD2FS39_9STRA|nr:unnamed protein product [Cylindrotheca closterium]